MLLTYIKATCVWFNGQCILSYSYSWNNSGLTGPEQEILSNSLGMKKKHEGV